MLETPILFLVFNRPEKTSQVFELIRAAKPKKLYVSADGARASVADEYDKCQETRKLITENVDWDCELFTLFRDENLGCKIAVSEGITWFFKNEEMGIILEDDCLPDMSFFSFCSELLRKYRNDDRVMHIAGTNFVNETLKISDSYYFSIFPNIWGWATWRRAWEKYDSALNSYPTFLEQGGYNSLFEDSIMSEYFYYFTNIVFNGKFNTWDLQWVYCVLTNNGLCIVPAVNLVSNIGFDVEATHTKGENKNVQKKSVECIEQVVHPSFIFSNKVADRIYFDIIHNGKYLRKSKTVVGKLIIFKNKVRFKLLQLAGLKPY